MSHVDPQKSIKLKELCRLLDVKERQASYVMERGFVPKGIEKTPDRGNHRYFRPHHAFWLGLLLKLKEHGIQTPLAATIATFSDEALRTLTQNLSWDWQFLPAQGKLDTEHEYYLDVGDMKHVRLATDANPSQKKRLWYTDWYPVQGPKRAKKKNIRPLVAVRIDLGKLALLLKGARWELST